MAKFTLPRLPAQHAKRIHRAAIRGVIFTYLVKLAIIVPEVNGWTALVTAAGLVFVVTAHMTNVEREEIAEAAHEVANEVFELAEKGGE